MPISESDIKNHVAYFAGLLEQMKKDLAISPINLDNVEDVIRAFQFSYIMNYDDKDLWVALCETLIKHIEVNQLTIQHIIKVLSVIDEMSQSQKAFAGDKLDLLSKNASDKIES